MSIPETVSSRRLRGLMFLGCAAVLAVPVLSAVGCAPDSGTQENIASPDEEALAQVQSLPSRPVCSDAGPGNVRCHAHVRTAADGQTIQSFAAPAGLGALDLEAAYKIPASGTGTVAIVDAFDNPNAEKDLAVYRAQYGLPPCTTKNGCFKKVNQNGHASPLPSADQGWGAEIALDIDMVSAACPKCKILLVEADNADMADLGAAINTAAKLGATAISNSWGGGESGSDAGTDAQFFNHPGVLITASSGDSGFGVQYPAASVHVLSVGGTTLAKSGSSRGWAEGAWSGAGSGCSAFSAKPSFQTDSGCARRTVADVSAVADPSTGVAVYDSFGGGGWNVFGGTSVASPLVAAIFVASGKGGVDNGWPYAHKSDFNDVTSGSNGTCSKKHPYLCTARAGYDGPTGLGTPNGAALAGGGSSSSSSSSSSTSSSSSSSGASSSSSSSSSGGSAGAAQDCVDGINEFRATLGLPPYARWTAEESCTGQQAQKDAASGTAHSAFGMCGEFAQNECPGWPGPADGMIGSCLQMMWNEGPGAFSQGHGHYDNMASTQYTMVSCGFHTLPDGSVWATQDFR